ncbi:MAG: hypothetical protein AAGN35_27960 [Bacteroidota bacterium]
MVYKKTPVTIDGYRLAYYEYGEDRYSLQFDGNGGYDQALNVLIGEVTQPDRRTPPHVNWSNLQNGIGRSDQGVGYSQHTLEESEIVQIPACIEMKAAWELANGRPLEEPFWMAMVNWNAPNAFIPHSSLMKILELARAVAQGETDQVVLLTVAQGSRTKVIRPGKSAPQKPKPNYDLVTRYARELSTLSASGKTQDLASASAKRRILKIELEALGLYPEGVHDRLIGSFDRADQQALRQLLASILSLNEYAGSEARRQWIPEATENDTLAQVPVAFDLFAQQPFPEDWHAFDALGRCERIWKDQQITAPTFSYVKLFGRRLKLITNYEDGERLVITSIHEMKL